MTLKREMIKTEIPIDYILTSPEGPKEIFLLLHGFVQEATDLYDVIKEFLPKDAIVVAPNGLFPIPKVNKKTKKLELKFTWMFYNRETQKQYFDYDVPVQGLCSLMRSLNLPNLPLTVIGFSQGGYVAPFFLEKYSGQIKQLIGIGAVIKNDLLKKTISYKVNLLHGKFDNIVELDNAKKSLSPITDGEFHILDNTGHRLNDEVANKIKELVN